MRVIMYTDRRAQDTTFVDCTVSTNRYHRTHESNTLALTRVDLCRVSLMIRLTADRLGTFLHLARALTLGPEQLSLQLMCCCCPSCFFPPFGGWLTATLLPSLARLDSSPALSSHCLPLRVSFSHSARCLSQSSFSFT